MDTTLTIHSARERKAEKYASPEKIAKIMSEKRAGETIRVWEANVESGEYLYIGTGGRGQTGYFDFVAIGKEGPIEGKIEIKAGDGEGNITLLNAHSTETRGREFLKGRPAMSQLTNNRRERKTTGRSRSVTNCKLWIEFTPEEDTGAVTGVAFRLSVSTSP